MFRVFVEALQGANDFARGTSLFEVETLVQIAPEGT